MLTTPVVAVPHGNAFRSGTHGVKWLTREFKVRVLIGERMVGSAIVWFGVAMALALAQADTMTDYTDARGGEYSTFQIVQAGAAPDSRALEQMTAAVKSWTVE